MLNQIKYKKEPFGSQVHRTGNVSQVYEGGGRSFAQTGVWITVDYLRKYIQLISCVASNTFIHFSASRIHKMRTTNKSLQ